MQIRAQYGIENWNSSTIRRWCVYIVSSMVLFKFSLDLNLVSVLMASLHPIMPCIGLHVIRFCLAKQQDEYAQCVCETDQGLFVNSCQIKSN